MPPVQVTIDQGILRGLTGIDIRGNTYYKFLGIPYAKPPLGELRFKAPEPPEKWQGIYNAVTHAAICYQGELEESDNRADSENCLFINVYTRTLPEDAEEKINRPVMFWIHPGDFVRGSGDENNYFPRFLMDEDVVVVTFNYRLGLLGFINFEDPSLNVPGNAGFKDQVMALRWVQNNISKFGGDPNNVTIFGENVGGISVHLLVLSPMSQGLFHKAIAQNGSYLSSDARGTKGTKPVAEVMGLREADDQTVYNTLMVTPVETIFKFQTRSMSHTLRPGKRASFGFVIEERSTEPFLDEEPEKIIASGRFNQIPLMIGYTSGVGMFVRRSEAEIRNLKLKFPWYLGYDLNSPERGDLYNKIKDFYFGEEVASLDKTFNLMSDCQYIYGIHAAAARHFQISKAPLYLYRIAGDRKRFIENLSAMDIVRHFLEMYIIPLNAEELAVVRLLKLWTNFVKFENPTPNPEDSLLRVDWKPTSGENLNFLSIKQELEMVTNPDAERVDFWKSLFDESPAGQRTD